MNERIRELAEQAGVFAGDFAGAGIYSIHNKDEVEKFAELIVAECAEIALADGQATGNFEVFNKITKHFRVEE